MANELKTIYVCQGTGCVSAKSQEITEALAEAVAQAGLKHVKVDFTGCQEFCEQGPVAIVQPDGIFYTHLTVEDIPEIVESHLKNGKPVERLYYTDPGTNKKIPLYQDITFNKNKPASSCGTAGGSIRNALRTTWPRAVMKACARLYP